MATRATGTARRARQRVHVAQSVWPTLGGAAAAFALAAYERLIWPQLIGCVLVAMVLISLAAVAFPLRLEVTVDAPSRVRQGVPFDSVIRIANLSRAGRGALLVRQGWPARPGRRALVHDLAGYVDDVPARDAVDLRKTRTPLSRGVADKLCVEVEIAAPFGFFSRVSRHHVAQRLMVLPAPSTEVALPVIDGGQPTGVGARVPDIDIRGVRDWRPGDRIASVHWRSVVRTGRMTVWERDGRSAGSLSVVALAPARRGRVVSDDAFEAGIATVAAAGIVALRGSVPICLVAQEKKSLPVVRHPTSEAALLECLAGLDVATRPSPALLEHALSHAADGGLIVVLASSAAPASWRAAVFDAARSIGAIAIDASELTPSTRRASA
ncbi:MAG TPA: DUF58 domain-containing protein [Acidothermaceae bacterium]